MCIVDKDFELRDTCRTCPCANLVRWEIQNLSLPPSFWPVTGGSLHDLLELPSRQVTADLLLVPPEDRDLDVLVRPGHAPEPHVERPAPREEPWARKARQ